jgi:hypothetical protein
MHRYQHFGDAVVAVLFVMQPMRVGMFLFIDESMLMFCLWLMLLVQMLGWMLEVGVCAHG